MRDKNLSLFSFQFEIVFNLLSFSIEDFVNMQDTSHQVKDYLRSYWLSFLDLCQKRNLKNIALTWVTLEKNSKFDILARSVFS